MEPRVASAGPMLEQAQATPWQFGFFPLLRRLAAEAGGSGRRGIGHATRPAQEMFRLGQSADLSFAPREIDEVVLTGPSPDGLRRPLSGNRPGLPLIRVFGLGLLGPGGPLPLHYTEWIRDRSHNHRDGTLANFLDIFHHRFLTLFYRAWAQGQAAAGLDRADDERFSGYIARLTGQDPLDIQASVLPAHARLSASAHLSHESRYPDGLAQTLSHYFSARVSVEEHVLQWVRIEVADQTRLGGRRASSVLASGALLGETLPDRQSRFRVVLGPLPLARCLRFTPDGADLPRLVAWVQGFVGFELAWELELRVLADSAAPAHLAEGPRLGWSTWLGDARLAAPAPRPGAPQHVVGLVFEPESAGVQPPDPFSNACKAAP